MRSFSNIADIPSARPIAADEVIELHASRILLLLGNCGVTKRGRIDGLTKLAKLDFFVRYPQAFEKIAAHLNTQMRSATSVVESNMVRHHYGPWDKRYYQVLPFLEARGLISVSKRASTYSFELTELGAQVAATFGERPEFSSQIEQMIRVKSLLGKKTGSALKKLIYDVFQTEVTNRDLGEVIQ